MKAFVVLLLGIAVSFGFVSSDSSIRSISPLTGKWLLIETDINGVRDTTKPDTKAIYYVFGTDNSFETNWTREADTTTYRIGGRYKTGKNMTRLTVFSYDKHKTKTVYEIQELNYSTMKLVSVRKENDKEMTFVNYFERVP